MRDSSRSISQCPPFLAFRDVVALPLASPLVRQHDMKKAPK